MLLKLICMHESMCVYSGYNSDGILFQVKIQGIYNKLNSIYNNYVNNLQVTTNTNHNTENYLFWYSALN